MGNRTFTRYYDRETRRGLIAVAEWTGRRLLAAAADARVELGVVVPSMPPTAAEVAEARDRLTAWLAASRSGFSGVVVSRCDLNAEIRSACLEAQALSQTFVWQRLQHSVVKDDEGGEP